ncbi:splicing regulator RBM11 [Osmia bicornis bicornis]|uniref:splicing regulator RBM11 n=1 Tax=Osmia bicornis bicornis TaxID=1437191 RepID=UPI0010F4B063|nr:splicing regulator RBM11 [Osmia bicornis bicornis]
MDEDIRTVWCGNLSEKVTEEILYELFLQGGPVQRVSIPKDRDGRQRSYGFVTYKHIDSVSYALNLFDGTVLFNRPLSMSTRKNAELPLINNTPDHFMNINHLLQLGQQMVLGNSMYQIQSDSFQTNMSPNTVSHTKKIDTYKDDRMSRRAHPYHRKQTQNDSRYTDHRSKSNYSNHRSNDYSRRDYKRNRRNYR